MHLNSILRQCPIRQPLRVTLMSLLLVGFIGAAAADDNAPGAPAGKSPRLKYRDAKGGCTCTCARGGLSEKAIREAEDARRAKTGGQAPAGRTDSKQPE